MAVGAVPKSVRGDRTGHCPPFTGPWSPANTEVRKRGESLRLWTDNPNFGEPLRTEWTPTHLSAGNASEVRDPHPY